MRSLSLAVIAAVTLSSVPSLAQAPAPAKPAPAKPTPAKPTPAKPAAARPAATPAAPGAAAPGAAATPGAPAAPGAVPAPPPPPPPTTGALTVHVTPAGATVSVDSKPYTPGAEHKAGAHTVQVSLAGYTPWSRSVSITAGRDQAVYVDLAAIPPTPPKPTITLDFDMKDTTVTIDGQPVDAKKGEAFAVEAGAREIKVSQEGQEDWTKKVDLGPGQGVSYGVFTPVPEDDGLAPWVTMGLGVGLGALGLVFSAESGRTAAEIDSGLPGANTDEDRATASIVLYTVGAGLIATGVALLVMGGSEDEDEGSGGDVALTPYISPDAAGLGATLRF